MITTKEEFIIHVNKIFDEENTMCLMIEAIQRIINPTRLFKVYVKIVSEMPMAGELLNKGILSIFVVFDFPAYYLASEDNNSKRRLIGGYGLYGVHNLQVQDLINDQIALISFAEKLALRLKDALEFDDIPVK